MLSTVGEISLFDKSEIMEGKKSLDPDRYKWKRLMIRFMLNNYNGVEESNCSE